MSEPIQTSLYQGFAPVAEPGTSGELSGKAALDDLCKTWNTMLDERLPLHTARILFDVDAAIAVLTAFKRHVVGLQVKSTTFKILKGKAR
jgi:hypothetical protein